MPSQAQFELIEAYLNQELSPADRQSFEQAMASDDALQADVRLHRSLRMGLHGLAVEQRVKQAHERYKARPDDEATSPTAEPTPLLAPRQSAGWGRWAAAASVVLGLGVGYYFLQQPAEPTSLAYAEQSLRQNDDQLTKSLPAHLAPTERRQLLTAIEAYKTGRYDAVIDQLAIPAQDRQTEPYRHYFLGLTYLAKQQPTAAIAPLQEAVSQSTGALRQKADWFLALAYLKSEQSDLARPILNRISLDSTHPYHSLAEQLTQPKGDQAAPTEK
ncbi:hypothetical protein FAES_4186 [Fibrella aestuarina BUZ 2]|uniref:Transmembrane anti-sigma factor n=1 Tax=Fibrella aestuarina BUZ 2 TaxID=1166018 RepID=I0KDI3_9BACT|nr:hypothetical protein [Fibrella aestuarina]CCH02186.1 hypothetical protein FAES_4186 [Fibrella aestuarina BUZ 2]